MGAGQSRHHATLHGIQGQRPGLDLACGSRIMQQPGLL